MSSIQPCAYGLTLVPVALRWSQQRPFDTGAGLGRAQGVAPQLLTLVLEERHNLQHDGRSAEKERVLV